MKQKEKEQIKYYDQMIINQDKKDKAYLEKSWEDGILRVYQQKKERDEQVWLEQARKRSQRREKQKYEAKLVNKL